MKLSNAKCRNARGKTQAYKLADGHGLYLFVTKNGSRLWRFDYRFDDKRQTMSFGAYPDVSLLEAREARESAQAIAQPRQSNARAQGRACFCENLARHYLRRDR